MADWSPAADAEALRILREHSDSLYEEAERITGRAQADTVSAHFVEQASDVLRLSRPGNGMADIALGLGSLLLGLAGGVGTSLATAQKGFHLAGWVSPATIGVVVLGALLFGGGAVAKFTRK